MHVPSISHQIQLILIAFLLSGLSVKAWRDNPLFCWINGIDQEKKKNFVGARVYFADEIQLLQKLQHESPHFMPETVKQKMKDCQAKLDELAPKARLQIQHDGVSPTDEERTAGAYEKDKAYFNAFNSYQNAVERLDLAHADGRSWSVSQTKQRAQDQKASLRLYELWEQQIETSQVGTIQQ